MNKYCNAALLSVLLIATTTSAIRTQQLTVPEIMAEPSIAGLRVEGEKLSPDGTKVAFLWNSEGRHPLDIYIVPTDGSAKFTRSINLNSDGSFTLTGIPLKKYEVAIKGRKWLQMTLKVDASGGGEITGVEAKLLAGDLNGDNVIELDDLVIFFDAYGSVIGDPNWNDGIADLTCDGSVELEDLVIFFDNYGQQGDP